MMAVVYPGQEFNIAFGNGKSLKAKALSGLQQQEEFAPLFQKVITAERDGDVVAMVVEAKAMLDYIAGKTWYDELWALDVDSGMVIEIATKLLERGRLDEDEEKN